MSLEGSKKTNSTNLSRRGFLGLLGGGLAAGALIKSGMNSHVPQEKIQEVEAEPEREIAEPEKIEEEVPLPEQSGDPLDFLNIEPKLKPYVTQTLSGRVFGGLLTDYSGIRGKVPKIAQIDFKYNLARMWKLKLMEYKKEKGEHSEQLIRVAKKAVEEFNNDSEENGKMNINQKLENLKVLIEEMRRDINWDEVAAGPRFENSHDPNFKLFKKLVEKITPKSLLSYSITELMPTHGEYADLGVVLYDFLLREAGQEYLTYLPARGDFVVTSMGSYQFTPQAVASVREMQAKYFYKGRHVPKNVENIRGVQSDKAAFIFAFYNLLMAISRIKDVNSVEIVLSKDLISETDVMCFMAAAHNLPVAGYGAMNKYVNDLSKWYKKNQLITKSIEPRVKYSDCIGKKFPNVRKYAQKTIDNVRQLI